MTDPLTLTIGAAEKLSAIAERLGVLEKLKRKLMKQPDAASAKLETALIEMSKIYGVLDNAVNDYLSLWLTAHGENPKWRDEVNKLRRLASGRHEVEMRRAKGDCQKIWSIYLAYLKPWFSRVLDGQESEELGVLFRELMHVDSEMVAAIEATSAWLTVEATATLHLVQQKDYDSADRMVQEAWTSWEPAAKALREGMKKLYDLRASFISVSAAV
jgi:hypothetical protein